MMPASASPFRWVRDEDLAVTVYDLRVVNSATQTKASSDGGAALTELAQDGVSMRVPRELCAIGHVLSMELSFRRLRPEEVGVKPPPKKPGAPKPKLPGQVLGKLVSTGKVTEIKVLDAKMVEVSIRFYQYDEGAWMEFCNEHTRRQLRVAALVRKRQE